MLSPDEIGRIVRRCVAVVVVVAVALVSVGLLVALIAGFIAGKL